MAPDLIATFIDAFNAEMRDLASSAERESVMLKRTLAEINRKLDAIIRVIEDGGYNSTLKGRLTALEQEKAQAEIRLRTSKPAPVLRLHTKLPELYRSKIDRLAEALNAPDTVAEAAEIMRGLIDRIILTPEGVSCEPNCTAISPYSHASPMRNTGLNLPAIQRDCRWLRG